MPWTQGEFKVPHNFVTEYNAGQKKIRADLVDENFTDIAGAVNKVVTDYKAADTALEATVNQRLEQTVTDLTAIAGAAFLAGGIVMFSGTFGGASGRNPIPRGSSEPDTNWVICDGGSDGKGGTVPDLRNRFIVGAGASYGANTTGGSAKAVKTVTGAVGATTLSVEQIAAHSHTVSKHCCAGSDGRGLSTYASTNYSGEVGTSASGASWAHTHSFAGGNIEVDTVPPYYALSFIMKIA